MSGLVETFEHAGQTVAIHYDDTPENPRSWDNLGTMIHWHPRYDLGDIAFKREDVQAELDRLKTLRAIVVPVFLYDHSGLTVNTTGFSCPWDSGQVGVIYCTPAKARQEFGYVRLTQARRDMIKAQLRAEVDTFNQYLQGDVYGFIIGDHLDSCWGFYGLEYCKEAAREAAEGLLPDPEPDPQLNLFD